VEAVMEFIQLTFCNREAAGFDPAIFVNTADK
jgi:hypothetical protein